MRRCMGSLPEGLRDLGSPRRIEIERGAACGDGGPGRLTRRGGAAVSSAEDPRVIVAPLATGLPRSGRSAANAVHALSPGSPSRWLQRSGRRGRQRAPRRARSGADRRRTSPTRTKREAVGWTEGFPYPATDALWRRCFAGTKAAGRVPAAWRRQGTVTVRSRPNAVMAVPPDYFPSCWRAWRPCSSPISTSAPPREHRGSAATIIVNGRRARPGSWGDRVLRREHQGERDDRTRAASGHAQPRGREARRDGEVHAGVAGEDRLLLCRERGAVAVGAAARRAGLSGHASTVTVVAVRGIYPAPRACRRAGSGSSRRWSRRCGTSGARSITRCTTPFR